MSNTKKGVSIYLAVMIMAIMLAIVLGLNTILVGQIKTIRNMGYSVVAFYAAETGIEQALYDSGCDSSACVKNGQLDLGGGNFAQYNVVGIDSGGDCIGDNYCLQSVGTFEQTKRAIQVSR